MPVDDPRVSGSIKPTDNAARFVFDIVEPTAAEFLADPASERRAMLACIVLSSMADHFFHARPTPVDGQNTVAEFRGYMSVKHKGYGLVRDIANASKHFASNGKLGYENTRAEEVRLGNFRTGMPLNGRYVFVEATSGHKWLVRDLVRVSMDMWREKLGFLNSE